VSTALEPRARRRLLQLARAAIEDALGTGAAVAGLLAETPIDSALEQTRGVFVTLKQPAERPGDAARLRGCIGNMHGTLPLYRMVLDLAPRAALADPRFPPMQIDEMPRTHVEVSVLTPLSPIATPDEIVTGRHGVQLVRGTLRAVFLPQVAADQGWDVDELLRQLAKKAGIPDGDWRGAALSVFEAEVFGETRP